MKKAIIAILIILSFIGCLWLLLHGHKYHIKTEFGDSFTVSDNRMFEDIFLVSDDYSKFFTSIYYFESENDFISLRDSKYFRCYQIKNDMENKYICKIKNHNNNLFFDLNDNNKNMILTNIKYDKERFFLIFCVMAYT